MSGQLDNNNEDCVANFIRRGLQSIRKTVRKRSIDYNFDFDLNVPMS